MPPRKAASPAKPKAAAAKKPRAPRKTKKVAEPGSVGLTAEASLVGTPSSEILAACERITAVGGALIGRYREPLQGHWVAMAVLPIDAVRPTPYQRELSPAHADRLAGVIPKVGRFLDPIIAVPQNVDGVDGFLTPNGMHRLSAMRALGAKAVTALVVPEPEVAFRILALNTEKAHNLKDKALEVVRMVRALVEDPAQRGRAESDFQLELEQPAFLTIGICYERNMRFSGGAYLPVVSRCESWSEAPLPEVLKEREAHAARVLELDEAVALAVQKLKDAGFNSGYLKPVVVARINPLRWLQAKPGQPVRGDFDTTLTKMIESAKKFDVSKVKAADIAAAAAMGGGEES